MGKIIRKILPKELDEQTKLPEKYKIVGSAGKGNFSEVPWIVVLDKEITDTPQTGYYIAYLFDADMKGVHLSLGIGWTQFEEKFGSQKVARMEIEKMTERLQYHLYSGLKDFNFDKIDLYANNNLGKGYARGHVCGKYYPINAVPTDEIIISDLWYLIGVYRELKGKVGKNILELDTKLDQEDKDESAIFTIPDIQKISFTKLKLESLDPEPSKSKSDKPSYFDEEKNLAGQKRNRRTGAKGENLVLEMEIFNLKKAGREDLIGNVKIVSENMSLGYDILSFEPNGDEKYIEVKSSLTSGHSSFYLTANELEKSGRLKNYYLYVVHGIDTQEPSIKYIKHPQFHSNEFRLHPRQYLVLYKEDLVA